jgi:hypothetical protein
MALHWSAVPARLKESNKKKKMSSKRSRLHKKLTTFLLEALGAPSRPGGRKKLTPNQISLVCINGAS